MRKLRIASPCPERWDGMEGDGDVRHCAHCKKDVTTARSLDDIVPGTCVRILVGALALGSAGCSSAYLEPAPTHTVVVLPPEAGPLRYPWNPHLDGEMVGLVDEDVDLPPTPKTKR